MGEILFDASHARDGAGPRQTAPTKGAPRGTDGGARRRGSPPSGTGGRKAAAGSPVSGIRDSACGCAPCGPARSPPARPGPRRGRRGTARRSPSATPVSYTHLRAHETPEHLVCRLLLEKKKKKKKKNKNTFVH